MTPFFVAVFLLGLSSLATAANFTLVYEWPHGLDFEWPSEANSRATRPLIDGTFKPGNIYPLYMAVYKSRIFLALEKRDGIPATLVSLPTSSASSEPPNLTPFPSWDMHEFGNCSKIEDARGLQVDSVGRLWVLDKGSSNCKSKLLTIDLSNNNQTKIIHWLPHSKRLNDLVLDETPSDTFVYIPFWYEQLIVVYSLKRNDTTLIPLHRTNVLSVAVSPKGQEPRKLYLGNFFNQLYLYPLSVTALNLFGRLSPGQIGKWTGKPYRMVMDNRGTLYSAFISKNYIYSWNTSQPFKEQRFYEVAGPNNNISRPFTIALDQIGTIWITAIDTNEGKPRYKLLKTSDSEPSLKESPVTPAPPTTTTTSLKTNPTSGTSTEKSSLLNSITTTSSTPAEETATTAILTQMLRQFRLFNYILFLFVVLNVILLTLLILRKNKNNSLPPNTKEENKMTIFHDTSVKYQKFHDSVNSLSSSPDLEAVEISQK